MYSRRVRSDSKTYAAARRLAPRFGERDFAFASGQEWPCVGASVKGRFYREHGDHYGHTLGAQLCDALLREHPQLQQDPNRKSSGGMDKSSDASLFVVSRANPNQGAEIRLVPKGSTYEVANIQPRLTRTQPSGSLSSGQFVPWAKSVEFTLEPRAGDRGWNVLGSYDIQDGEAGQLRTLKADRVDPADGSYLSSDLNLWFKT